MNKFRSAVLAAAVLATIVPAAVAYSAMMTAQDFATAAGSSDMFEIESSKMALQKSSSATVKEFAQMMIKDHTQSTANLMAAAQQDGVSVPAQMITKDVKNIDQLELATGGAFDSRYIGEQRAAHEQALALLTSYAQDGSAPALKAHAAKIAPVVEMHLEHLKSLR